MWRCWGWRVGGGWALERVLNCLIPFFFFFFFFGMQPLSHTQEADAEVVTSCAPLFCCVGAWRTLSVTCNCWTTPFTNVSTLSYATLSQSVQTLADRHWTKVKLTVPMSLVMAASVALSVAMAFSFLFFSFFFKKKKRKPQAFSEGRRRGAAEGKLFVSRVWCYLLYCYVCVLPNHQRGGHLAINMTVVSNSCITFFLSVLHEAISLHTKRLCEMASNIYLFPFTHVSCGKTCALFQHKTSSVW